MTMTLVVSHKEFQMPEFCRTAWVSKATQEHWEPIIHNINDAHDIIEWQSVFDGMRKCAFVFVEKKQFIKWNKPLLETDILSFAVIDETDGHYRVCISKSAAYLRQFSKAWGIQQNENIASLLGYPPCCGIAFRERWNHGWRDLNAFMGSPSNPYNNIFLRWIGVRPFFHLPCSSTCEKSKEIGERIINLHGEWIVNNILELLNMPFEYSSLHGIVQVKTPIFTIVANGDMYNEEIKIRGMENGKFPKYSTPGNSFPYVQVSKPASIHIPLEIRRGSRLDNSTLWTDNGFDSEESQERYHEVIVSYFRNLKLENSITVLDLGCGNGELLRKIASVNKIIPHGIERDLEKVKRARTQNILCHEIESIKTWGERPAYVYILVAKNRFLEYPWLREEVIKYAVKVLVYDYSPQGTKIEFYK
jgi:hypothetical protein